MPAATEFLAQTDKWVRSLVVLSGPWPFSFFLFLVTLQITLEGDVTIDSRSFYLDVFLEHHDTRYQSASLHWDMQQRLDVLD